MKTIEVNLIGDLRQTYSPRKGALPQQISKETVTPEEAKQSYILIGVGGTAALAFVLVLLTFIGCFAFGMYMDNKTSSIDEDIIKTNSALSRATKEKTALTNERQDLIYKQATKKFITSLGINIPEVLQELRAKIPSEITLIDIKRAKGDILIKGQVSGMAAEPLKSISYFIVNINTMKPEESYVKNAFLASVVNQKGSLVFSIKAEYQDIKQPDEENQSKDEKSKDKN